MSLVKCEHTFGHIVYVAKDILIFIHSISVSWRSGAKPGNPTHEVGIYSGWDASPSSAMQTHLHLGPVKSHESISWHVFEEGEGNQRTPREPIQTHKVYAKLQRHLAKLRTKPGPRSYKVMQCDPLHQHGMLIYCTYWQMDLLRRGQNKWRSNIIWTMSSPIPILRTDSCWFPVSIPKWYKILMFVWNVLLLGITWTLALLRR